MGCAIQSQKIVSQRTVGRVNKLLSFRIKLFKIEMFSHFQWVMKFLGLGEFLPSNGFIDWISDFFCNEGDIQIVCSSVIFLIAGYNERQVNATLLETIINHAPAGTSTNTLIHFAQEINSSKFL